MTIGILTQRQSQEYRGLLFHGYFLMHDIINIAAETIILLGRYFRKHNCTYVLGNTVVTKQLGTSKTTIILGQEIT